jgi:hypothetical protein
MITLAYCTFNVIADDDAEPEIVWVCEPPPPVDEVTQDAPAKQPALPTDGRLLPPQFL